MKKARIKNIMLEDKEDPVNVVYSLVWEAKSKILSAVTEAELNHIETQFEFARRFCAEIGA